MTSTFKKVSTEEWLAGVAMLLVMGIGFWQASVSLRSPAVASIPLSLADFRNGRMTGALGTQLDQNLPIRSELIGWANAGRYLIARGAGDQVRLGQDDWLFSVEELQIYPRARSHEVARLAIVSGVASALKADGITLVVAMVPDKSRMLHQKLSGAGYPYGNESRYSFIVDALRQQSVAVIDLQPALSSDQASSKWYYRTDTHWNQAGAKRAALAVASQVKALAPDLTPSTFLTQTSKIVEQRPGDLMRMMGLGDMPNWARPRLDMEAPDSTLKVASPKPSGLFDEVSVPVVLMGTSYSLRGNFHGYLQQALEADVLNVARDGGGFMQAAKAYFADESFYSSKPRVIIWEIPERVFSPPLTDMETKGISF